MIDYKLLDDSIEYYELNGFKRIEVPWLVTEAVDSITRPKGVEPFVVEAKKKNLIASGEQGFLYLYLKEYLPLGRFQTITPCFRNEPFDYTHSKYFMKNELIDTQDVSEENLMNIIKCAKAFFDTLFPIETQILKTDVGYDIMIGDVELGSYGIRQCEFVKWIYGTAIAEPRTSKIVKLYKDYGVSLKGNTER